MAIRKLIWTAAVVLPLTAMWQPAAFAATDEEEEEGTMPEAALVIPVMNAERGRALFAEKGCVLCHSVNGIGGEDAESFDSDEFSGPINPFHIAAKMWEHAPAMIAEQEEELGAQIELEAQDLADIVAFLASPDLRKEFSEDMLPERIREALKHEESEEEEEDHGSGN